MKKIDADHHIWAEKYRPQCIDDLIITDKIRNQFKKYIEDANVPHLLLYSQAPGLGKCLDYDEEIEVYIDHKKLIFKIGDLFKKLNISKIDELEKIPEIYIKTPSGELTEIKGFIKKSPKSIYNYKLENGINIKCSDEHLFQENGLTKKAKDCKKIDTIDGQLDIINSEYIKDDYVYDISINSPHLYVTPNGVIHHNTSLTSAIIKELDADVKWINGSQDRGIDTFRVGIKEFVTSISIDDSPKIVVIDEADGLTKDAQKILRGIIEEYSRNTTFILTCNYKEQLIEQLVKRLTPFDFDNIYTSNKVEIGKQIYDRTKFILENENVIYTDESVKKMISALYPSIRELLIIAQKESGSGELLIDDHDLDSNIKFTEIMNSIKNNNFVEIRKAIQNLDDAGSLYTYVFKTLESWFKDQSQPQVIILCAKYQELHQNARDKAITASAFCVELMATTTIEFK